MLDGFGTQNGPFDRGEFIQRDSLRPTTLIQILSYPILGSLFMEQVLFLMIHVFKR